MFRRVLIANRGAIACRIIRTLRKLGVEPVAVYSEADEGSLHVAQAAEAVLIGPAPAAESYLDIERILDAAHATDAEAIHPGYGFLSENAAFAEACEKREVIFLGPTPGQIRAFGLKNTARELAVASGVPVLPGTALLADVADALEHASEIGYPVMLKSAGGGGGIGMRRCASEGELIAGFESVARLSATHFGGSGVFLEKFIDRARHIEVQIFGDGTGNVIALGERDCSTQRRNQKVIEEAPAPNLTDAVRENLARVAISLMQSVQYRSAGTIEFLYDADSGRFYFLEVNSRLQVEHGVTEEVWGVDLVEWMVRLGAGDLPPLSSMQLASRGWAMQARLYAENPLEQFAPSSGRLTAFDMPSNARCETALQAGAEVTPYYDPLLAKVITRGDNRAGALAAMRNALAETAVGGIETNLDFLRAIFDSPAFDRGEVTTAFLNSFAYRARKVKVLASGAITTLQAYPGRLGYWAVGVPPSGPMDDLSHRIANRLVGNRSDAATLECTLTGPELRFLTDATIAICGADMLPVRNGQALPMWQAVAARAGDTLKLGGVRGGGARAYVAVAGGFDAPEYLGSRTTFTLGHFGGHGGRALQIGDYLTIGPEHEAGAETAVLAQPAPFGSQWTIGVVYGPHAAPDFFSEEYVHTFFSADWRVHHNSSRTGVRLIGPKPGWTRQDGGDAGLHPSNIHDNAYAVGAIDFTGDMPVILGPDGPSLGGFVCPAVVASAELWKVGQLSPGDTVRFVRETHNGKFAPAVLAQMPALQIVARASGDRHLLVEFGEATLDLTLRFRAHALMKAIEQTGTGGIIDLTPGIRSLQVHYDPDRLPRERLLALTRELTAHLPSTDDLCIPSRLVHLPLSWDDPATRLAIERYASAVRADAPWCPSNIEFIRRMNGLHSIDDVHRIVFNARYLLLGLGDVYLGAPVATPIDPRHRLVTTKYNPARTWTPENAVGIGGAYLCVYGMEGPGGYQFVGRTVQMWNTYRATRNFEAGKPWLLRFFDQIQFHPMSAEELLDARRRFPLGRFAVDVEHTEFRLGQYHEFLNTIAGETAAFRRTQTEAFAEERRRWAERGEFDRLDDEPPATADRDGDRPLPAGCAVLRAPTTASVWRVHKQPGQRLDTGEQAIVLEAMKMEIAVHASEAGEVVELLCRPGSLVTAGQPLLIYRSEA